MVSKAFAILLLINTVLEVRCAHTCSSENYRTQPHFNVTRYLGPWYEIEWIAPVVVKPSEYYDDYVMNLTLQSNGDLMVKMKYRVEPDKQKCQSKDGVMKYQGESGKYIFERPWKDRVIRTPNWVIKTDYTHYAVIFGCNTFDDQGSCSRASASVWSRQRTLSHHFYKVAQHALQHMCLDTNDLEQTHHNHECILLSEIIG